MWIINICYLGGSVDKESAWNAEDTGRRGFNPWVRKISWRRTWQPIPWRIPMDGGAWWAKVHRVTKSQTRLKWLSTHAHHILLVSSSLSLVSVSLRCHRKLSQLGWFKQWKLLFSQIWRMRLKDQGVGMAGFERGISSCIEDRLLPAVSHMASPLCGYPPLVSPSPCNISFTRLGPYP